MELFKKPKNRCPNCNSEDIEEGFNLGYSIGSEIEVWDSNRCLDCSTHWENLYWYKKTIVKEI